MATQNLTRTGSKFNHRRTVELLKATVNVANLATSGDTYELFELPDNCMVLSAQLYIVTAWDSATSAVADVGIDGGDTLIDGADLKTAATGTESGGTNAVVPRVFATGGTVTILPTYNGAPTVGEAILILEIVELDKVNGNLLDYSDT